MFQWAMLRTALASCVSNMEKVRDKFILFLCFVNIMLWFCDRRMRPLETLHGKFLSSLKRLWSKRFPYRTRDSEVVLLVELFDEAKARSKDILIERVNIDFCLPASFTFWGHLNRSLNLEFNSVQVRKWTPEELLDQTAEAFGYTDGAVK